METINHYIGNQITEELINQKNLIAMRRYSEGYYSFLFDGINTIYDICFWTNCNPEDLNLILGKDWYIMYVVRPDENRRHFPKYSEYVYHDIRLTITDRFIQRYKKDSNKSLK